MSGQQPPDCLPLPRSSCSMGIQSSSQRRASPLRCSTTSKNWAFTAGKKRAGQEDVYTDYLFRDCSQRAVSRFGCGKSSVIQQALEMQSEDTSVTRDPLSGFSPGFDPGKSPMKQSAYIRQHPRDAYDENTRSAWWEVLTGRSLFRCLHAPSRSLPFPMTRKERRSHSNVLYLLTHR
jgi:hypothetical protein